MPPPLFRPTIKYAGTTELSHPLPSYRCTQDIVLGFVYDQTEIYLIRHSKQHNLAECYHGW